MERLLPGYVIDMFSFFAYSLQHRYHDSVLETLPAASRGLL